MTNNNTSEFENEGILQDAPLLKDSKPPKKWPWIIAAIVIVVVVMSVQFGAHFLMEKITHKNKEANPELREDKESFKALPLPLANKMKAAEKSNEAPHDVIAYLEKRKVEAPDELARLRLMARLEERKKAREEIDAMIQSPALLNIGVGVQNASAQPQNSNDTQFPQNPNTAYLKSISNQQITEVNADTFGDLRFRIRRGKILRGVTESAIDSDLPGMIRGHVTEDIYGDQGDIVLIPNGASLLGEYRSGDIKNGQMRLYVVWTRLQLSNGIYVTLDSPGSDPLGRAGMTGEVDHHYLERYGASLLTSIVSAGAATWGVNGSDRYNSEAAYRQGISSSFAQTANQELQKNAVIQNTIRPPQGTEISILVNKDISFEDILTSGRVAS